MSPLHLLVVDDSPADLHLLTAAFDACPDVQLTTYDQASLALSWLEVQVAVGQLPDLVVLDVHMPGMDSLDWLRAVRQQPTLQDVPVLLYSLTPVDRQLQQVDTTQVCGCWQKPLSFTEMQQHAQHLWTLWQRDGHFHPAALRQPDWQK